MTVSLADAPPVEKAGGRDAETASVTRRLVKGNEALALGGVNAGAEAFFGYPITPQNEIPEILSDVMPRLGRVFLQAESEVASINMVYGAAAAGHRVMTSSSSPGVSLMMEGLSYCAGARLPCLLINVMRGGPGLGNIAPSQSDYFQATKGGGHGDYRCIVLAPWNVQEMFDFPALAFDLAEKYRMPAMILADAVLGSMVEPAEVPEEFPQAVHRPAAWATTGRGKRAHKNVANSLFMGPEDLGAHCEELKKDWQAAQQEVRYATRQMDDAEYAIVAFGIAARIALSAVAVLRKRGVKVGLVRPITLYPFPTAYLAEQSKRLKGMLTFELNAGQMFEDVQLAALGRCPVEFYGKMGGILPAPEEVADALLAKLSQKSEVAR